MKNKRLPQGEVAEGMEADGLGATAGPAGRHSLTDRARWIPLRLNADERRLLRLLEAALSVSDCEPLAPRPIPLLLKLIPLEVCADLTRGLGLLRGPSAAIC